MNPEISGLKFTGKTYPHRSIEVYATWHGIESYIGIVFHRHVSGYATQEEQELLEEVQQHYSSWLAGLTHLP